MKHTTIQVDDELHLKLMGLKAKWKLGSYNEVLHRILNEYLEAQQ